MLNTIDALKLCVEVLDNRFRRTGINTEEAEAKREAQKVIKRETGEVWSSKGWQIPL